MPQTAKKIRNKRRRTYDPTKTIVLRRKFVAQVNKRYRELKGLIRTSVVTNDCFGLKENRRIISLSNHESTQHSNVIPIFNGGTPADPNAFAYRWNADKIKGFMAWLKEQQKENVLELVTKPGAGAVSTQPWSDIYLRSAYQRGMERGRRDLVNLGVDLPLYESTPGGLSAAFNSPFHAERVGLIYTRTFSDLEGVTEVMDTQISRVLANGLSQGHAPYQIARDINNRVDKIGIVRSRLIARTETILSHNMAAIGEYGAAEKIIGREVRVSWLTAGDERVRDKHIDWSLKADGYTRLEAEAMLGEPNCRCATIPILRGWKTTPYTKAERAVSIAEYYAEQGPGYFSGPGKGSKKPPPRKIKLPEQDEFQATKARKAAVKRRPYGAFPR